MELLTFILSGLLSILSSSGLIVDLFAGSVLRSPVISVEQLAVRIDNVPSHQIIQGKVQRLRIASRGVELKPDLKINVLELETDPIEVDFPSLTKSDNLEELRQTLRRPLQGAIRLIITQADINRALASEATIAQLQKFLDSLIARRSDSSTLSYTITDPRLELLEHNRIRLQARLRRDGIQTESSQQELQLKLEWGLKVADSKQIQIVELIGTVNGQPISRRLLQGFAEGIGKRLNLDRLENAGIIARILQLEINQAKIRVAAFGRMETKPAAFSSNYKDI